MIAPPLNTGHTFWCYCITYSPDGNTIATGDRNGVNLWDADTVQHKATYKGHTDNINSITFSPDGDTILAGTWDGRIHLWEVETGEYKGLRADDDHTLSKTDERGYITRGDHVTSAIYSPDGFFIASAVDEKNVRLWDVTTGKHIATFTGHTDLIHSIAFSPDGSTIASASSDKTVRLWDVATGKHIKTLEGHTNTVYTVAYSPDGNTIVTGVGYGNDGICIWDVVTGELISTLKDRGPKFSIVFSPDGTTIAAASGGGVNLWDADAGILLKTLSGHSGLVETIVYSPDGTTIASVDGDGTMILWDTISAFGVDSR